jgi:hypothetical protein
MIIKENSFPLTLCTKGLVMLFKKNFLRITFFILLTAPLLSAYSAVHMGRLGLGFTNQLTNDITALSFKLQKSPGFAMGGLLGMSNKDEGGGYGAGLKIYKIIFDEPNLNFYGSVMGALLKENVTGSTTSNTGFQFDFTFGSEFTFKGIESLGFSVEFGLSLYKLTDLIIETLGNNFIKAGVHFYL